MCRLLTCFYSIVELNLYVISGYIPTVNELIRSLMIRNETTLSNAHSENTTSQLAVRGGADKQDEEWWECTSLEPLEEVYTGSCRAESVSSHVSPLASSL